MTEINNIDFTALPVPGCEMCNGQGWTYIEDPCGDGWLLTDPVECECVTEQRDAIEAAQEEAASGMSNRWQDIYNLAMESDEPPEKMTAPEMALYLYDACLSAGILIRINAPDAALFHLDRATGAFENHENQVFGE